MKLSRTIRQVAVFSVTVVLATTLMAPTASAEDPTPGFNTPAMTWKLIGKGSQYAWGYLDSKGNYLDGGKNYKLNIPKDPPAEKFWSVVAYDPQTRSELQTSQPFPSKQSQRDKMIANDDGSIDLYFGPEAPAGKEANWIQTVPGKGWFSVLRLYSPTEAWYDQTWRPGEIELVE